MSPYWACEVLESSQDFLAFVHNANRKFNLATLRIVTTTETLKP